MSQVLSKDHLYLQTFTGNTIWLEDLTKNTYRMEDVAHSLSNQCRYNGHTSEFYSVAQHSYYVSQMVPKDVALEGLLHDMAESISSDIPSPAKQYILGAKEFDNRFTEDMFRKFNLKWPMPPEVHEADLRMLFTEGRQLMPNCDIENWQDASNVKSYDFKITPWKPAMAKQMYLDRYQHLWYRRVNREDELKENIA